MAIRLRLLLGAAGLLGLAACASIIGLDGSDPAASVSSTEEAGASSSSGGGGADLDGGITTEAGITVGANTVTFQPVTCNIAQTQAISIANRSAAPSTVEVSLPANDVFTLVNATDGALKIEIPAGATDAFIVQAKSAISGPSSADVIVKIGDEEHHIALSLQTSGGTLALDPSTLDFGQIRLNTPSGKQKVAFRNDGTAKITVNALAPTSANFVVEGLPFELEPGASTERDAHMASGSQLTDPLTETLTAQVDGLCSPTGPTIVLKGQRLDAPFTINPQSANFGDVNCGTSPGTRTVVISNYENNTKPFSVALASGGSTFAAQPQTGEVGPGSASAPSSATITISIPALPQIPQDYNDTLNVTVGGQVVPIALHVRPRGVYLETDKPGLTLKRNNGQGRGSVKLINKGNVAGCVQYRSSSDTFISEDYRCYDCGYYCTRCELSDNTDTVPANGSTDWSVRYFSGSASTVTITSSLVRCDYFSSLPPLCGTAPKITITGTN